VVESARIFVFAGASQPIHGRGTLNKIICAILPGEQLEIQENKGK
jgi:hypothetical protein